MMANLLSLSFIFIFCHISQVTLFRMSQDQAFTFSISKTWKGGPTNQPPVQVTLQEDSINNRLIFSVKAPFYNEKKPAGRPGEPTDKLWQHEVVEVYFMNEKKEYLQIIIGPHGHHFVLFFNGERNLVHKSLPLEVSTQIMNKEYKWEGTAFIPGDYFPPQVTRFNAFVQNGPKSARRYWALYPEDGSSDKPNFHQLKYFKQIALKAQFAHRVLHSRVWREAYDINSAASLLLPSFKGSAISQFMAGVFLFLFAKL